MQVLHLHWITPTTPEENGRLLLLLVAAAAIIWLIAIAMFYAGLRRYESGSAINVNV